MFFTICQACPKVGNYRQITKRNIIVFIYCIDFQFVALDNIARHVTYEDYEAGESRGIKPDIDDFTPIQHRKKSDHNRKTFSAHSRFNPLFYRQLSLLIFSLLEVILKDYILGLKVFSIYLTITPDVVNTILFSSSPSISAMSRSFEIILISEYIAGITIFPVLVSITPIQLVSIITSTK